MFEEITSIFNLIDGIISYFVDHVKYKNIAMNSIFDILSPYKKLLFEEAIAINLNERFDSKYLTTVNAAINILEALQSDFLLQEGSNQFFQQYKTKYWDTHRLDFFTHHAKGKLKRFKVRKRLYTSTNTAFLEIKKKDRYKTLKFRMKASFTDNFSDKEFLFLRNAGIDTEKLLPVLDIDYNRVTLWDKEKKGRITLDFNFTPSLGLDKFSFDNVVIIEIKGSRNFINTVVRKMPFPLVRYSTSFSKYGIGMVFCHKLPKRQSKNFFLAQKKLQKLNNIL